MYILKSCLDKNALSETFCVGQDVQLQIENHNLLPDNDLQFVDKSIASCSAIDMIQRNACNNFCISCKLITQRVTKTLCFFKTVLDQNIRPQIYRPFNVFYLYQKWSARREI